MAGENPIRQSRDEHGRSDGPQLAPLDSPSIPAPPTRKVHCVMILMQQSLPRPRRLRAALIGFGLDDGDDQQRLTRGDQTLIVGGSAQTHAELRATALRMEQELDRRGRRLGDLDPVELAELADVIDSPELHEIALRLKAGLEREGRAFEELTAEELTALSAPSKT